MPAPALCNIFFAHAVHLTGGFLCHKKLFLFMIHEICKTV
ncbi:hypothetical protein COPCOM_02262 [Coprococcus comes ATCC 27758]|uniref:Uncharacterized protein n=1 Tax=Coprococcus comes ATCC 27758 TaxID=470146 RepID=C0BB09_9FIRM|nr:hypothetical protein COPCOM_02262 [Coprococcus comes ATCC 27758]